MNGTYAGKVPMKTRRDLFVRSQDPTKDEQGECRKQLGGSEYGTLANIQPHDRDRKSARKTCR